VETTSDTDHSRSFSAFDRPQRWYIHQKSIYETFDSCVVDGVDARDVSLPVDVVTDLRSSSELAEDESADRLDPFGLERSAEPFVHVLTWDAAVDDVRSVVSLLDIGALRCSVEFVSDVADNLLEDVLDGRDPFKRTPFVDDDGNLAVTVRLKLCENRLDSSRFQDYKDVSCQVACRD
jgi:hypothetical protein